jgi:hypothetical protein
VSEAINARISEQIDGLSGSDAGMTGAGSVRA